MSTVTDLGAKVGVVAACAALGVARATYYRRQQPKAPPSPRKAPPRALPPEERKNVLAVLHEPRFADQAPAEVYATLLDEKRYLCSVRTMYRILEESAEVRERRDQLRHPNHPVPRVQATAPNQLWSWDITKLLGPAKWTYFYLYVLLDVYSRYVVGWMVATEESKALAMKLIRESCDRQGIQPGQLTIHADRGPQMTAKNVALLMADLGVTKTHSRPHVSNDNPFSEAHFKTLKYRPDFPDGFGCLEDSRSFLGDFFGWYNDHHHHHALNLLTPRDVHYGLAEQRVALRNDVLAAAYAAHPERFPLGKPLAKGVPSEVWINKPKPPADVGDSPMGSPKAMSGTSGREAGETERPSIEPPCHAAAGGAPGGVLQLSEEPTAAPLSGSWSNPSPQTTVAPRGLLPPGPKAQHRADEGRRSIIAPHSTAAGAERPVLAQRAGAQLPGADPHARGVTVVPETGEGGLEA